MKGQSLMSEADKNAVWNTAVTRIEPNRVAVRGYDIAELMGRVSFGAAVYLILTSELPSPAVARLMDAILVHRSITARHRRAHWLRGPLLQPAHRSAQPSPLA